MCVETGRGHWKPALQMAELPHMGARTVSVSEVQSRSDAYNYELGLSTLFLESVPFTEPGAHCLGLSGCPRIYLSVLPQCWGYRHCCNAWLFCRCRVYRPPAYRASTLPTEPSFQPPVMSLYKWNKFAFIPWWMLGLSVPSRSE